MKFAVLPFAAISLLMVSQAGAQGLPVQTDSPQMSDAPRTKRERDLGLEGKPRGQRELSAPDAEGNSTEEPDDDDEDLGEALQPPRTSKPKPL